MLIKVLLAVVLICLVFLLGPLWLAMTGKVQFGKDWRTANRSSVGIAAKAGDVKEAMVQLYEAKAFNWRGLFAVHTWIAVKPKDADHYTSYQVIGWNLHRKRPLVDISFGAPDRSWFGHEPVLIKTVTGTQAELIIPKIQQAAKDYPYPKTYHAWPGPNSNTFIAYILGQVPELGAVMPANALGKDYASLNQMIGQVPSHSGYRLSLLGLLGLTLSQREGLQINVLGLTLGVSWRPWGVIIPGVGLIPKPYPKQNLSRDPSESPVENHTVAD